MNKSGFRKHRMVESMRRAKLTLKDFLESKEKDLWWNSRNSEGSMKDYLNEGVNRNCPVIEVVVDPTKTFMRNSDWFNLKPATARQVFSLTSKNVELKRTGRGLLLYFLNFSVNLVILFGCLGVFIIFYT